MGKCDGFIVPFSIKLYSFKGIGGGAYFNPFRPKILIKLRLL